MSSVHPQAFRLCLAITQQHFHNMDKCWSLDTTQPLTNVSLYQSAVSALMFTTTYIHANLTIAVQVAALHVVALSMDDWKVVKHIFLYLANTANLGIFYCQNLSLNIVAYLDASWADNRENCCLAGMNAIPAARGVIFGALSSAASCCHFHHRVQTPGGF